MIEDPKPESIYNFKKLRVLASIRYLQMKKHHVTSKRMCLLTGMPRNSMSKQLNRLSSPKGSYIIAQKNIFDNCSYTYRLTNAGKTRLKKMLVRFKSGYSLGLRFAPENVDYKGAKLLPGIAKYEEHCKTDNNKSTVDTNRKC